MLGSEVHVMIIKMTKEALAGVTLWIECRPVNQKVTGLIPGQGTCLGRGPGPSWAHTSLPLFLPCPPLSKNK